MSTPVSSIHRQFLADRKGKACRLKSSTRQGRTAVRRGRVTNRYASEDNSLSVSVLGKRRHGGNDNHDDNGMIFDSDDNERIFDSGDNEGDFGEAVEGDDS